MRALACCSIALGLGILASAPGWAQMRNYKVIDGGRETPVYGSGTLNKVTCASVANMFVLRHPPAHGSVRFAEKDASLSEQIGACPAGAAAHRTLVLYRPQHGFSGMDRFWVYEAGGANGRAGIVREMVVYVRDPRHPNTAVPNPADLNAMLGPVSLGPSGGGGAGGVAGVGVVQHVRVKTRDVVIREREIDVGQAAVAVRRGAMSSH